MKITQLRGDLTAFRNLELSIVLNAMKTENSRKPVSTLRQDIPYLTPQTKSLAAEKIPVVLFGATLKRDGEKVGVVSYTGLVLLSIGNLIGKAEAAGVRRRVAGFPQTLACFIGSSGRSIKVVIPFTLPDGLLPETEEQIRFFHAHAYLRASRYYEAQLQLPVKGKVCLHPNKVAVCRMIPTSIITPMRCLFGWNNPCRCLFRQRRAKCIMPKKTRYGVWRPDMNVINVSRCSMKPALPRHSDR